MPGLDMGFNSIGSDIPISRSELKLMVDVRNGLNHKFLKSNFNGASSQGGGNFHHFELRNLGREV